MKLGFIGLGIMGSRMAANLQAAGHELVVYNRTRAKADDLIAGGAVWADSPAAVGAQVDLVITILAHPNAVKAVVTGPDGLLAGLPEGALWVDSSTVNPSFSREMVALAQQHNIRFVDAPVAGSKKPATDGTLLFLVGGAAADVELIRPLMSVMGRDAVHVGEAGMGSSLKMVVNMLMGIAMAAFSEGVELGKSLGIS